jgi:Neuraminidase (sialidase)
MKLSTLTLLFSLVAAQAAEVKTVTQGLGYFPVMIRLKSGELLSVIRGGGAHVDVRGRLDLIMSKDEGTTWSAPWTAIDEEFDDRNPALGQLNDGTVLLAYAVAKNYDETGRKFKGPRTSRVFDGVYLMRSKDKGKTWSKPERSETINQFYVGKGLVSPYGKMAIAKDGTLLMAVYFEFFDDRGFQSYIFRSKDKGRTWGEPALMGAGFNETGITVLPDGTVLAALRSGKGQFLSIALSADHGRTWSEPAKVTNDLQHPGDLISLKDGRVLLTFGERNPPRGVKALLSRDGGKTWGEPIVLASDSPNVDTGYPSSVQLRDGSIATIYYQVDSQEKAPESASAKVILWKAP